MGTKSEEEEEEEEEEEGKGKEETVVTYITRYTHA
jgi:hypothetical protein